MNISVFNPGLLCGLTLAVLLGGCVSQQIGGPTAPRDATDAGILILPTGRTFAVYPHELAYTGAGSFRWPDGREYTGRFEAGQPSGVGSGTWPNGDRYHGTWRDGEQHGHGELNRADGSRYVGDFVAGSRQGRGVEETSEGLYRGDWLDDLPSGHGEFHGLDGASYQGQWFAGVRDGHGSYTDARGNHYRGEWRADVPEGFGVMENITGSVYEGEWRGGVQNGYGRMTMESGVVYEGTWVDGRRQGFGVVERPDGSRYEGEWHQGQRDGEGRESFADGSYHEGAWEMDRPMGPGTRRDRTGIEITGVWNDDLQSSGMIRLPSGAEYAGKLLSQRNTKVEPALVSWLELRADEDDAWAHFFLGTAFTDFTNPSPDHFKATGHFRVSASAGIPDGQFRLGLLLLDRSPEEALQWLTRAADSGQAQANALLGEYYLTGTRVPADPAMAVRYLEAGSSAGDMSARTRLAWVLATARDPALKNATRALTLIRPLALMRGEWQHFDTLAAAHAALGNFPEAAAAEERAIDEARQLLGDGSSQLEPLKRRLSAYQTGVLPEP